MKRCLLFLTTAFFIVPSIAKSDASYSKDSPQAIDAADLDNSDKLDLIECTLESEDGTASALVPYIPSPGSSPSSTAVVNEMLKDMGEEPLPESFGDKLLRFICWLPGEILVPFAPSIGVMSQQYNQRSSNDNQL